MEVLTAQNDRNAGVGGAKEGRRSRHMETDAESTELRELLDTLFERYGVDFRDYAYSSLKRRVKRRVVEEGAGTVAASLRLTAASKEAADQLVISLSTVKRHIANAYGKLGVDHRTEAVARLRS